MDGLEFKGTPGPWHIAGFMGQHDEDGASIRSADNRRICSTWGGLRKMSSPNEWARYHADARLIAAAPDLLESLIEYVNGVPTPTDMRLCLLSMNAYGKPEMQSIPEAMEKRQAKARAAIAKALGQPAL